MARFTRGPVTINHLAGTFAALLALFAILTAAGAAGARPSAATGQAGGEFLPRTALADVGRGTLVFDTGDAEMLRIAPEVATDVHIIVSGLVARTRVSQTFRNPGDDWVEGVYVFPLPETAAVDRLRVRVGERVIEGRIKERDEARRVYETAKREGRKAGLIESERPNTFTTSIANIGPGEEIAVDIEYQEVLRYDQGRFRLRFPMVVGPRYIPGAIETVSIGPGGWALGNARVPDAARITAPVAHPDFGKRNPLRLRVDLNPGFALAELASTYHPVAASETGDGRYAISLRQGEVPADRDFELVWTPETGTAPAAGLFVESKGEHDYVLVMVVPPAAAPDDDAARALPREVIFVVDTSGSMAGGSIEQAKAALILAIEHLAPGDRFNVIEFNSRTSALFRRARVADAGARARAIRYVAGLDANGGTEMAPALERALSGRAPNGYLRQVIFLTDGSVGNEAELFEIIHERLGDARLFTVGIGSAPNSYFMRQAAEEGRGSFTHIGEVGEVGARMAELFEKIEQPVLTDLRLAWPDGVAAELSTDALPDLYAGEPVVFTARLRRAAGSARLDGRFRDSPWSVDLPLAGGAASPGIGKLWARDRIDDLMARLHRGGDAAEVRSQVVALGLEHHLVTEYTSLVAIDATPSRPADAPLMGRDVPLNLPHGWDYDKVFGEEAHPPMPLQRDAALAAPAALKMAVSEATLYALADDVQIGGAGLALPQTATHWQLKIAAGATLTLLGLVALALARRRRAV